MPESDDPPPSKSPHTASTPPSKEPEDSPKPETIDATKDVPYQKPPEGATAQPPPVPAPAAVERDEFGLPIVKAQANPDTNLDQVDGEDEIAKKDDESKDASADDATKEAKRMSVLDEKRQSQMGETSHVVSEFSHQLLAAPKEEDKDDNDGEWQTMPAYARYDMYDDDDRLVAREHNPDEDETYGYAGLGGAGKGYTRVIADEDAESETSMDDNTRYLFNNVKSTSVTEMDDEARDAVSQLQATKDLLTEGQRIAYVGMTRLELAEMVRWAEAIEQYKGVKKLVLMAGEAMRMWSQKIMIRLYAHMEISQAEQVMIEQLAEHGVRPEDLTPVLMQNARVKNPMADRSPSEANTPRRSQASSRLSTSSSIDEAPSPMPPPYEAHEGEDIPEVKMPSDLPDTEKIDIDLRWTVLCDLFLVLIADSVYDARSRVLLERIGKHLQVPWIDICKFERRVTEALEMQQQAEKENWNEDEHIDNRQKMALKKRYVMMGLATVGGGLVIGLSAGLMAPLIGAGLAAGFTAIGVGGTSSFLAGAGGAAIITSGSVAAGSFMGGKAANRRTGAVKTFEYRPLHNNKRVNLIVTVAGWMTNTNDDVRLPFSTVDPLMGDLYSLLWEPEMLKSMGDTINILATEAMTQSLQQILGQTFLMTLMAGLQAPVILSKLSYLIDNPWTVSLDRAWAAGLILADSLIDRNLGTRPIILVGYSLGARVIFSCLLELARKGAYGVVQDVYLFGSPLVVKKEEYLKIRTVVAGRIVNGYNGADWILGYLFRLTNGGIRRVAGLAPIEDIPGLENLDCKEFVVGHMDYRTAMPRLLRECDWLIESDEFIEIEDPDPDKHRERQLELINEIEEARREFEKEEKENNSSTKKKGWNIFGRKKNSRQAWEVYEEKNKAASAKDKEPAAQIDKTQDGNVLFDVDAIRAELAKIEQSGEGAMEVKELKSTLPPMKLDVPRASSGSGGESSPGNSSNNPRIHLRETKSDDGSNGTRHHTPLGTPPPPAKYSYSGNDTWGSSARGDDSDIKMTFDDDAWADPPRRPEAKSVQTTPALPSYQQQSQQPQDTQTSNSNPWSRPGNNHYDDDDDDFGKEQDGEISMTFA